MKSSKKLLALLLAIATLFAAAFAMTACSSEEAPTSEPTAESASGPPQIRGTIPATKPALVVNSAKAKAGDKAVEVTIAMANNPGILGMDFDLYYDDTVLTLTDAQSLLVQEGCEFTPAAYYKNPTTFLWDFQDAGWAEDGAILKLCFNIADDAPAGKYEIRIMYSYGNIFDENLEPIDVGVKNGNISIS